MSEHARIVFCDFDGTITAIETFVKMLRTFTPDLAAELIPRMREQELTLREGVRKLVESIPSEKVPEIVAQVKEAPLREGLDELLDFLDERSVPFVVLSSGLRIMVEAALGPERMKRTHTAYALDLDTDGQYLRVRSELEAGDELVAKARVMERHPADEQVAIGDSITDFEMAEAADLVFARADLLSHLKSCGADFVPFETFHDIREALARRWS